MASEALNNGFTQLWLTFKHFHLRTALCRSPQLVSPLLTGLEFGEATFLKPPMEGAALQTFEYVELSNM